MSHIDNERAFAAEPVRFLRAQGYSSLRQLPTGEWAGISQLVFTYAILVGLDADGYKKKFCFESHQEAVTSLLAWNGEGFPPGYWVKGKIAGVGEIENKNKRPDPDPAPMQPPMRIPATPIHEQIFDLIEKLREEEASSITINADNADFSGPNSIISCNGWWTGFADRNFSGDSVLDCLKAAVSEMAKFDPKNPPKIQSIHVFSTTYKNRGIVTTYVYPPIPPRVFDWCAHFDDEGEEAHRYGWGETEHQAVAALIENYGAKE